MIPVLKSFKKSSKYDSDNAYNFLVISIFYTVTAVTPRRARKR
jgi:hypothetical protein